MEQFRHRMIFPLWNAREILTRLFCIRLFSPVMVIIVFVMRLSFYVCYKLLHIWYLGHWALKHPGRTSLLWTHGQLCWGQNGTPVSTYPMFCVCPPRTKHSWPSSSGLPLSSTSCNCLQIWTRWIALIRKNVVWHSPTSEYLSVEHLGNRFSGGPTQRKQLHPVWVIVNSKAFSLFVCFWLLFVSVFWIRGSFTWFSREKGKKKNSFALNNIDW